MRTYPSTLLKFLFPKITLFKEKKKETLGKNDFFFPFAEHNGPNYQRKYNIFPAPSQFWETHIE